MLLSPWPAVKDSSRGELRTYVDPSSCHMYWPVSSSVQLCSNTNQLSWRRDLLTLAYAIDASPVHNVDKPFPIIAQSSYLRWQVMWENYDGYNTRTCSMAKVY